MDNKITEEFIVKRITEFLHEKENGQWDPEKTYTAKLHQKGVDIKLKGGKRHSEYFLIECKGKSYAPSEKSVNAEGWLNALGQIITRMDVARITKNGDINRAYKYGLGLYWKSAQKALERIPKKIAVVLNLHIFAVNDDGKVIYFTPSMFGKKYEKEDF